MADPFSLAASIIAVIQISGKVISVANSLLDSVHDAPRDLQVICNDTSTIKSIFESFNFPGDPTKIPPHIQNLGGQNGPIEGCKRCISALEKLINVNTQPTGQGKRRRVQQALTSLAWPLKKKKARELLHEMLHTEVLCRYRACRFWQAGGCSFWHP